MGLDISYYKTLGKLIEKETLDQCEDPFNAYLYLHLGDQFVQHADGISGGFYANKPIHFDDVSGFQAGSYGMYSGWRESLSELMEHPSNREFKCL